MSPGSTPLTDLLRVLLELQLQQLQENPVGLIFQLSERPRLDDAPILHQRHLVAFEPVPAGKAAGGNRGGGHAGHRREDRAMIGGTAMIAEKTGQRRRVRRTYPARTQPIADDQDGAAAA